MSDETSRRWPKLPLRSIATEMCLGKMLDKQKNRGTLQPYLRNVNVRWFSFDLSDLKKMRFEESEGNRFELREGDLVICEGGEPGRAAVWRGQAENAKIQKALHRVRFNQAEYDPTFAMYYLYFATITNRLASYYTGTTIKHLTGAALSQVHFPILSINEQRRIVAKIEELFSDLDAGVAALERAKANLKRYRASVLKAAVEGKLTKAWRAEHPDTAPASKLLERILAERRQKWEADQLAKFAAAGKQPPKNWRDKYVEPSPPDTKGLPGLPEGWCWASVQQVGSVQLGRQRAPQHHSGPHMRPYLRVANVFEDRIDVEDVMQMNFTPAEFETYRLGYGDLLLNEGQSMELVGRPAMYRDEVPGACFTNTLVRFRASEAVTADYALKVFLAYLKNGRFQKIATITVNIAHLGAGRFSEIEFPLPAAEEQKVIVEEIERHFSIIAVAEQEVDHSLRRATRLRQSILKQAFEGQLVPQDPTDEPASVLLERLRASRLAPDAKSHTASSSRTRGRRGQSKSKMDLPEDTPRQ